MKTQFSCIVEQKQQIRQYFKVCQELITNWSVARRETESNWECILLIDTEKLSNTWDKRDAEKKFFSATRPRS